MVNYYTLIGVHEQASDDEVVNACHDITRPPGGITPQSLASRCNLYTVLGVDQKATHKDISHAYEDILLPPDGVTIRRPRDTKLLDSAFEKLTDDNERKDYDMKINNNKKGRGRDSDLLKVAKHTLWEHESRMDYDYELKNSEEEARKAASDDTHGNRGVVYGTYKERQLRIWKENKSKAGR